MLRVMRWLGLALMLTSTSAADEIELPNRTFDPSAGVEQALRDRLADPAQTEAAQAIVQFVRIDPLPDRDALRATGVELGPYVGGGAFIARIAPGTDPDAITERRWAGLVLPKDKISKELWDLANSAPGGSTILLVAVHFEPTVTTDEATAVIASFPDNQQTYGGISTRALRIPRSALESLAMQPRVRWLEAIRSESFPLPAPP